MISFPSKYFSDDIIEFNYKSFHFIYIFKFCQNFYIYIKMNNDTTISEINIDKYCGFWYEIFSLPIIWEKNCIGATTQYLYEKEYDRLKVFNTCIVSADIKETQCSLELKNFESYTNVGYACIPNKKCPGKLKISFPVQNPGYVGDYWIHYTDYKNFSVVGSPDKQFLWLLSRRPFIFKSELKEFLYMVECLDYDIKKIQLKQNIKVVG